MMNLIAQNFPEFYRAVNGYAPFPWQVRLVEEVANAGGLWPAVLDLPTSAGKTSALDAAVFLLALQAGESVHERRAAIRMFFVVDRRIVVDEAAEKARNLARQLNATAISNRIIKEVADRLKAFSVKPGSESNTGKALHVSVLRGGMYRDGAWAESPTQPTICLSTVDQVGSRLLFRGYGVSRFQRAVHAGLVGNDSLILVDEAHLSRPFIETLRAVEFYRSDRWAEQPVTTPFQVVVMSATAGRGTRPIGADLEAAESDRPLSLKLEETTDRNPEVCPELHRRLTARKRVKLAEAAQADFVPALVRQALALAEPETGFKPVQVVGVVVNRVGTARQVAERLRAEYRKQRSLPDDMPTSDCADVVLLTGRIRPYDRDELLFRRQFRNIQDSENPVLGLLPFVKAKANKDRTDYDRPAPPEGVLFVVATQTVEVGADFSFDALVTELAPLDALRQRFGRVDRLGFRGQSRGVILRNKDAEKDDLVYGKAPTALWKALKEWEKASGRAREIDFGIQAIEDRLPRDNNEREEFLAPLCNPLALAPVMMPAHVDGWTQSSVSPEPDPDPALFLHGPKSGPADVSVVWRTDVTEAVLEDDSIVRQVVALVPPTSMEAMSLPIRHVQNWLCDQAQAAQDSFSDLEGEREPESDRRREDRKSRPFLIWKGPGAKDGTRVSRDPEDIRPGNTLVVPASYGGCDQFGWNPESTADVTDVADDCSWRVKRRPVLRVHPSSGGYRQTLAAWQNLKKPFPAEVAEQLPARLVADADTGEIDWGTVAGVFRELNDPYAWLRTARRMNYPDGSGVVFISRQRKPYPLADKEVDLADVEIESLDLIEDDPSDDEANSFLGTEQYAGLEEHCRGVLAEAQRFIEALRMGGEFSGLLSDAALLHDVGKADPRFQAWLYGSEAEAARNGFRLIAKSRAEGRNVAALEAARRRAGWPRGARHEAGSVVLIAPHVAAAAPTVPEPNPLVYLVGAHHGRSRGGWRLAPPTDRDESILPAVPVEYVGETVSLRGELPARPEAPLTRLDSGWLDEFWGANRRFGPWGVAYLEALLILADQRRSAAERQREGTVAEKEEDVASQLSKNTVATVSRSSRPLTSLALPGLRGTEPIGFLAGVGLLRVLTLRRSFGAVKLGWSDDSGWSAVLYSEHPCDEESLIHDLLAHMRGRASVPVFAGVKPDGQPLDGNPWDDVKVSRDQFAKMLSAVRAEARATDREAADFYSALGSELIALGNKDAVKPSALHMTSGNQAFLESARELARSLDSAAPAHPKSASAPADAFREAVFARSTSGLMGWQAADEFSSMGFDAAREAIYALTATAPGPSGPRSTRAAVWLAIEALPMFPAFPSKGRLHTRGFDLRATAFRWPIWEGALTADSVCTAVGLKTLTDPEAKPGERHQLGIRAVMQSERVTIGQGYGQLRPALRVR